MLCWIARLATATQPDRKAICMCFRDAMQHAAVNYTKAAQFYDLCHFASFMPMEPDPDCSK